MTAPRQPRISRLVAFCALRAPAVLAAGLVLGVGAALFAVQHFSITTDINALLPTNLPWRQRELALGKAFPQTDAAIAVVIDARTPELAQQAAGALSDRLSARPDLFPSVRRADGGGFWAQNGLLFASRADVKSSMDQLITAQPFLGPVAADPSLHGLMGALSTALQGVTTGQAKLDALHAPIARLADGLEARRAGRPVFFSWRTLISGKAADPRELRQIILVIPKIDYAQLQPGAAPSAAIRAAADGLKLDAAHGVSVRLTGSVPLEDEEFGSLAQRAGLIASLAVGAITLMLWLATRSARIIGAILTTTFVGLVIAAAWGLAVFHTFNVISVAFIPLFVGLGIDFGIQFAVRFRTEHAAGLGVEEALAAAGGGMGRSLSLAALAIAAGFLAFAPTSYRGVSQLGVIAGCGMIIALALNLTLLPALIRLAPPGRDFPMPGQAQLSRLDDVLLRRRRQVLGFSVAAAALCAALLPLVRFDFNPLHMRNARAESVAALLDLARDPDQSPNTIEALLPNLAAADAAAARVAPLREVAKVRTLSSLVPADQPAKLALISDASLLLDLTLNPLATAPPPSDADVVQALRKTAADLRQAAGGATTTSAADARRLAADLETVASATPAERGGVADMLIPPLNALLDQARASLQAQPVTLQSLPPELVRDWVAPDGRARISVSPRGNSDDNAVITHFTKTVGPLIPGATGAAIGIENGAKMVVGAFVEAGVLSFIAITLLLFAVLRRVRYVAITMAPIVLTGLLTMGTCVVIGQPLNYANIIALPLLFGIGVAFHIYFVMSWRAGGSHLLTSSLARAIFFSAMTTATGFGSLWMSSHPGTASMGKLLMISLVWTLVSALLFQPALMGQPPAGAKPDAPA
ncbi:MAG: MMPL family transporter [Caulobacterales bacterium]